jgi:hypothetical protein
LHHESHSSSVSLALQQWLQGLGVPCDPADHGVADAEARVHAALASARGRNFIGAPT